MLATTLVVPTYAEENEVQEETQQENYQEQIDEINETIDNEILPVLTTSSITGRNRVDFNDISSEQLNLYKNNKSSYQFIFTDLTPIIYFCNIQSVSNNNYSLRCVNSYNSDGSIYYSNFDVDFNYNTNSSYARRILKNTNKNFILEPYKLTLNNNGLGTITNSVNIEPYLSTNIYYSGQSITLTYNDSNNDFTGWYDNQGNLLSNQLSYTFSISSDTTIILNYPRADATLEDIRNQLDALCILVAMCFFAKIYWEIHQNHD